MSIQAKISTMNTINARVTPQHNMLVTNYKLNASSISVNDLIDVDSVAAQDGAVLVYDGASHTWKATSTIENQNTEINGGFF